MDGRSRTFQGAPGAPHALCFVYVGIDPVLDGNGFFRAYRRTAAASHTVPPVDPGFAFDRHKRFPLCFDWIQNTTAYHGGSVTMSHKKSLLIFILINWKDKLLQIIGNKFFKSYYLRFRSYKTHF